MKRIWKSRIAVMVCLTGFFLIPTGCFKNITQKYLLYSNDFENNDLRGLEAYDINGILKNAPIVDFNGSKVLGRFNNNRININALGLPAHNAIEVTFDLYIHDKWDGNLVGPTGIPDIWQMAVDNNPLLITTFSNNTANLQAFPNFYLSANANPVPAKTSASNPDLKGVCSLQGVTGGTTYYRIEKIFPHSSGSLVFSCNDALQPFNSLCLKSWSIDNISITAIKY